MYLRLVFALLLFVVLSCKRKEAEPTPVIGGCFIKTITEDGILKHKFNYNEHHQLLRYDYIDPDGYDSRSIEFIYESFDKVVRVNYLSRYGDLNFYVIPTYNDKGRIVLKDWYTDTYDYTEFDWFKKTNNTTGFILSISDTFYYNSEGKLYMEKSESLDDSTGVFIPDTDYIKYNYNSAGNKDEASYLSEVDSTFGDTTFTIMYTYGSHYNPLLTIADKFHYFNQDILYPLSNSINGILTQNTGDIDVVDSVVTNTHNYPISEIYDFGSYSHKYQYTYDCQ